MDNLKALLYELDKRGIRLSLIESELKIQAPKGTLTPDIMTALKQNKVQLIQYLSNSIPSSMDFSLFFFASDDSVRVENKYQLVLEAAQLADQYHFEGIWCPERHFHPMGGLFPNPSVMMAALSTITKSLKLRCGSVVAPLHDPIRVAEEWAMVDNLSSGRVEMSFASGWHVDDFVFQPDNYNQRRELMFKNIATIQQLWRGESIERYGGAGTKTEIKTRPRPLQSELPLWVTAIGNPESYQKIGAIGANLLTCLLDQEVEELAEKIKLYRQALSGNGFNPDSRKVCVFLHTYVGEESEDIRETVRNPFMDYLKGTLHLLGRLGRHAGVELDPSAMSEADQQTLLEFAFERYLEGRTLIGDMATCQQRIQALKDIDVQEVACLVDWGLGYEVVMSGLERLAFMKNSI